MATTFNSRLHEYVILISTLTPTMDCLWSWETFCRPTVCSNQTIRSYSSLHTAKADIALPGGIPIPHLRATGRHLSYGITQCYLPPDTSERAPLNPDHAGGTRFTFIGGMEGWVDLVDLIAPRPGVEPATFRSRVRRWTAASPRQPWAFVYLS